MTRVLVVDNHDSFVHTLVGYLSELGAETVMIESDATDAGSSVASAMKERRSVWPAAAAATDSTSAARLPQST